MQLRTKRIATVFYTRNRGDGEGRRDASRKMFQTIVAGWCAGKSRLIYALLKEFERPRVGEGNLVNGAKCSVSLLGGGGHKEERSVSGAR